MGGSIVAARCAEAGKRVLVLEKGSAPKTVPRRKGIVARLLDEYDARSGERWPEELMVRREEGSKYREVNPLLGIGPGGSARLYGAALGRAQRADFERDFQPRDWNGGDGRALTNSWPVSYDEFLTAYRVSEDLLGLVGTRDPLDPEDDANLGTPPPLSPAHEAIVARLKANGRHPYRMHVGIAYKPGCSECQGSTCPRDCKAHGFNRALSPAMESQLPVTLEQDINLVEIGRGGAGWAISFVDAKGIEQRAEATALVLAAGALNTPRILQDTRSIWKDRVPELIGRGLMFHASEIFSVRPPDPAQLFGPRKVIAFRDSYLDGDMPLAECQSLGMVAKSGMIAKFLKNRLRLSGLDLGKYGSLATRPAGEIAERIYQGAELFTGALQDLPYEQNRVSTVVDEAGHNRIAITYRPSDELIERICRFRELMTEAFAPFEVRFLSAMGEPNLGHPMGTCRMGRDSDHSVTDEYGRVWNQDALYIADASVFPSSLGVNPALTVAAHAVRVANAIGGRA